MREWIEKLSAGEALDAAEAETAFHALMQGKASPVETAAFLVALGTRGETAAEIAGGVRALRRSMVEVPLPDDALVDTCGTGGGSVTTFNISTVAALVAAGGGVGVAKHGNRSFTSRCGSADLLEALDVRIDLPTAKLAELFGEASMVFMFAPSHHPAMRHVAAVRRELGIPTIMNLLGPLTSPARVRRQVVGVSDPRQLRLVAESLRELGHQRALVVHGEPGLDEFSPLAESRGVRLENGNLESFSVSPDRFGWGSFSEEDLAGGSPEENATLTRELLEGRRRDGARAAVLLNAAAAFWAAEKAESLEEGVSLAESALDEGAALEVLERLRKESLRLAEEP